MNNEQLEKGNSLKSLLKELKKQRAIIAESNSLAIGKKPGHEGCINTNSASAYFSDHSQNWPVFFQAIPEINDTGLNVAFSAFKAMLLSVYDQKIAEAEKEFDSL